MKRISMLLALIACAFAQLVFANSAVVTSLTGTVTAQTGAATRTLRQGDEVVQGATIKTGPQSSAVLRFADGQVAALTANSTLAITTYQYEAQTGTGSVLLSLVQGGMRAITGLIGKSSPTKVSYRAGTATIGIRGTDVTIATNGGDVVVTVTEGAISFTYAGKTLVIPAGQGVNAKKDGSFQQGAAQQIINQIPADLAAAINGVQGLQSAIQQAARPNPPGGGRDNNPTEGNPPGPPSSVPGQGNGGTPGGGGGGGGGGASKS
jgi:hypothetical protein